MTSPVIFMTWRTLIIEYLSWKHLVKFSSSCFLQILSQIWVNVTTLQSGRLEYFFNKQERLSAEALVIALSKVCAAAMELEILSPDWNMEYFCNK
jgi:hypothetical protein